MRVKLPPQRNHRSFARTTLASFSCVPKKRVLLTYGSGKNDIVYVDKGSGGLDEFKTYLTEDKIFYGILEVVVKGKPSSSPVVVLQVTGSGIC